MKEMVFRVCLLVLGFILLSTLPVAAEDKLVVIPILGNEATGDATEADVLEGKTFSNDTGTGLTGTMPKSGCVCEGILYADRFCDNGDGTVTDLTTCLVWLQKADWGTTKAWRNNPAVTCPGNYQCYNDAHTRAGLLAAGASGADLNDGSVEGDWRLPTMAEMEGLVNGEPPLRCETESCDLYAFTGVQGYTGNKNLYYWTSATIPGSTGFAWAVSLKDGGWGNSYKEFQHFVWPVRAGK